ncbi:MAG: DNA polymerase III subunit delta' [Desulfobulbaceae bacterium A2]|nr:MAG: DNA polymerase III subunit delta' [Desulfobulbaceae bacterium A2]
MLPAAAPVVGQERPLRLLQRALAGDRLAHAYLLRGPEGVGKRSCARALAAAVLCQQGIFGGCGACPACRKLRQSLHPDFVHLAPQGTAIKIDQVRGLKEALRFAPLLGERRVVLLERVQAMRPEAANSLLKVLEEPPPGNLLLLTADENEPILSTIASRCQLLAFGPLPRELAAQVLRRERPELDPVEALALAALAEGSPGRGLALHATGVLAFRRDLIERLLDSGDNAAATAREVLALANEAAELKEHLPLLFDLLRLFFRDLMVLRLAGPGFVAGSDLGPLLERARERWSFAALSATLSKIDTASRALAQNVTRTLVCETLLFAIASPEAGG